MVERLFNSNPINGNDSECTVANTIKECSTFDEGSSSVYRHAGRLATINENLEGYQFSASNDRSLSLNSGRRIRRNSHPGSARESNPSITYSPLSNESKELRASGGRTKCLRDPMLSLEITPKNDTLVFNKHKLDKIDEADSSAELRAERDFEPRQLSNSHTKGIMIAQLPSARMRRRSHPTDLNYVRNLRQQVDIYKCSEDEILSRWVKFF